jgi:hypothetical protein
MCRRQHYFRTPSETKCRIYFDSAVVSNVQNKYRRFREIVHCDIGKLTLRSKNVKRYIIFAT